MDNSKTFRDELAIQYPTLGRALWEPDPGRLYSAVQVGDVGFIRHGYFTRLFNALPPQEPPSDHPPEPDPHFPHYLKRLQPRTSDHIRTSIDHRKDFRSKNVTNASLGPNIDALGPDDDTQVSFSCSGKQGALLYLPFPAERKDTVALGDFGKWIIENIYDCMRLVEERGLGVNRMEDIILVTGRHLARSWARAVFSESRGGAEVSFVAKVSKDSVVHLEERNASGAQLEFGPNSVNTPENQCIFVRGYHVVRILNIWPRLRGLAGPAPLPDPDPEPDTHLQLMGVPADDDDPLHTLLEYIAEQNPSCDMVLVHDDDLKCIENAIPPLETLQPDTLMESLRDYAPKTRQFQYESFSGNENEPEAEVTITTVATLSLDVFGELHDEGTISSPISTSKMTLSEYERLAEEDTLRPPSPATSTSSTVVPLSTPFPSLPSSEDLLKIILALKAMNTSGPRAESDEARIAQEECRAWFVTIDQDGDGVVSSEDLRSALLNNGGLRFSLNTVKYLMSVFDHDGSGVITYDKFQPLWMYMTEWRQMFDSFDGDRDGWIDATELGRALAHYNMRVGPHILDMLVEKYGIKPSRNRLPSYGNVQVQPQVQPRPQMGLDHFVCASIVVRQMCDLYEKTKGGRPQISRDEFLRAVISLP